jgi:hypothetical protein
MREKQIPLADFGAILQAGARFADDDNGTPFATALLSIFSVAGDTPRLIKRAIASKGTKMKTLGANRTANAGRRATPMRLLSGAASERLASIKIGIEHPDASGSALSRHDVASRVWAVNVTTAARHLHPRRRLAGFLTTVSASALFAAVIAPNPSAAQTWTGTTSSDWNTGTNWSGGVVPTSADIVTINTTTPNPPIIGLSTSISAATGVFTIGETSSGGSTLNHVRLR